MQSELYEPPLCDCGKHYVGAFCPSNEIIYVDYTEEQDWLEPDYDGEAPLAPYWPNEDGGDASA